jgi:two-component system response regulator MprA
MQVMVVDDEPAVRDAIARALKLEGYAVRTATDGTEALRELAIAAPDAVVLDVLMPELGGLEVCRRLRGAGDHTPVLILTARDSVSDRVDGLDAGADDYLVKPFALEELLARLRALLRRADPAAEGQGSDTLEFAELRLDFRTREVSRAGTGIELTKTEFELLHLLMRHPRQVLTRTQIFEAVWDYDFGPSSNALEVYVGYLRRKTEAGGGSRLIQTVRGVGYALRES